MASDSLPARSFSSTFAPTPAELVDIQQLARSGSLPVDPARIRAVISGAPADLERYDAEIENLKVAERNLQRKLSRRLTLERETLASYAAFCRSVLSPAQKLPNELLGEIFDLCLRKKINPGASTSRLEDQMNLLARRDLQELAQVCFRWYCVAIGTPQLWSMIIIYSGVWDRSFFHAEILMKLLESFLIRGKDHPLTIEMTISDTMRCDQVLALLSQHAQRWREVDFLASRGQNTTFHRIKNLKLDRLVSLSLDVAWEQRVKAFRKAPVLTELSFKRDFESLPRLPWSQIKTVSYDSLGAGDPVHSALSLLRAATNLTTCRLYLYLQGYDLDDESWGIHTTSRTQKLYIQLMTSTGSDPILGHFLDSLTLPHLNVLDIHPNNGSSFPLLWSTDAFLGLADRSGFHSSLTYLALHVQVKDVDLLRCLSAVPLLEKLLIRDCTPSAVTDTFLRGLQLDATTTTTPDSAPLVPNLAFFSLRCALSFTDPVYFDLLASRTSQARDFQSDLWWYATRRREVSAKLVENIAKLVAKMEGRFVFKSGAYHEDRPKRFRAILEGERML
ncbi:hypothetical protein R3P38DRAFT_3253851 [Favolaschia claudopus]|uniref:F-box domain-containing protein n=1 Tax=Favolaschia claudopus TaxID=2862362 RepID=A0AAW0DWQ4_9AGAR